jgi:hypothetical protein
MLLGIYFLALLPLFWLLMPRQTEVSFYFALGIAVFQGIANMGWAVGLVRLFFVSMVPADHKSEYMGLYYAWISLMGGVSVLLGGQVLDRFSDLSGDFYFLHIDSYTLLLVVGMVLPLVSVLIFRYVRSDGVLSTSQFVSMFLRGNPFVAFESLLSFHRAKDERHVVSTTERLGKAKSPLTVEELIEALDDPRFYVRFEALVSIARRGPDDRLLDAVIVILGGSEPALSVIAAWALGRIDDKRAVEPLRAGLDSHYRSVRAHCARSLGTLGDDESIPLLLDHLVSETDIGLKVAYISSLGRLKVEETIHAGFDLMDLVQDRGMQMELALAIARTLGDEHVFIRLNRQLPDGIGTPASSLLSDFGKKIRKFNPQYEDLHSRIDDCADAFAKDKINIAIQLMVEIISCLVSDQDASKGTVVLSTCGQRMQRESSRQMVYLLLALYVMKTCW